jgi:hypothetical protein
MKVKTNSVTERQGLSTMKQAYDLHAVHTTVLQKNNVCQPHSNKAIISIIYIHSEDGVNKHVEARTNT